MRPAATHNRIRGMVNWWLGLWLFAGWVSPALGQQVSLQTDLEYRLVETESADGRTELFGRFSPRYLLALRGPVFGGSNVYLDLGLTGYSTGDQQASVDQRNLRLNLLAEGKRLNLTAFLSRDANRTSLVESPQGGGTALVVADSYAIAGLLSYPNYPRLSLQYLKSTLRPQEEGPATEASTRMVGLSYDWGPLRFTADDARQETARDSFPIATRTYSLSFAQSALPTVRVSLDHYAVFTDGADQSSGAGTSTAGRVTRARVSALPTPFLVVDADVAFLGGSQDNHRGVEQESSSRETGLYVRSEILPGVRLDVSRRSNLNHSGGGSTSSDHLSGTLAAQLRPTTNLLATWARSTSEDQFGGSSNNRQDARVSLTSELSPGVELSASYGRTEQQFGEADQDAVSASLGLSRQLDATSSLSLDYHYYQQNTTRDGEAQQNTTHSMQLSATLLPNPLWGLRLGMGVARNQGNGAGLQLTPSVEARWDMDPATMITVRYDLRHLQQAQEVNGIALPTLGETSSGLTGRLTHSLPNGSTFEIGYDYGAGLSGPFVRQKILQLRYSRGY